MNIGPTRTRTFHVHSHIITGPPKCPIECKFGQCASGLVFTTQECASASLVNVRVVRFLRYRNVRVLVWSMCEWSGFYNIGMCEW